MKNKIKILNKIKPFKKIIEVSGDKSISIRSILLASQAIGTSRIYNLLESEDVKSTIEACKKLGVKIVKFSSGSYKIYGKGLGSFFAKKNTVIKKKRFIAI